MGRASRVRPMQSPLVPGSIPWMLALMLAVAFVGSEPDTATCSALWRAKHERLVEKQVASMRVALRTAATGKFRVRGIFDPFLPEWVCDSDERLGSYGSRHEAFGDGPKFVCGIDTLKGRPCLVYSIGSNNDYRFEATISSIHPHCEIHTFDPTLRSPFKGANVSTFHDSGLGAAPVRAQGWRLKLKSLKDMMTELGHTGRKLDLLKVDCEGCEYDAFVEVFANMRAGNLTVDQILIELHLIGGKQASLPARTAVHSFFRRARQAGLWITHTEPNYWGCDGYRCQEYVLVSQAMACREFVSTHCPGAAERAVCST